MLRTTLAIALIAVATPTLADESSAMLAAAFDATIVSTYPDGRTAELWLNPDGTYSGLGRERKASSGRWRVEDGKLCFRQTRPFVFGYVYCTHLAQFSEGRSWIGKAVTGETIQIRLINGRSRG